MNDLDNYSLNRGGYAYTDIIGQKFRGVMDLSNSGGIKLPGGGTIANAASGTWTPTDSSGAGLAVTGNGFYLRIENWCFVNGQITYPVTADVTANGILGFPFTTLNDLGAQGGVLSYHNGAVAIRFATVANTKGAIFYTAAGARLTNAQLSNTLSQISAIYKVA